MFIQIFLNAGRSVDVKRELYARIAENLGAAGVRADDILINLVEMAKENWSFGGGELSCPPAVNRAGQGTRVAADKYSAVPDSSAAGKRIAFVSMSTQDNLYSIRTSSTGQPEPVAGGRLHRDSRKPGRD